MDLYDKTESVVKAMTRSGNVVYLPFDLRVPLARYLARSKITNLKRFNISSVYREKKIFGLQPKECFECAFDIISPAPNLINDAEIIAVTEEIMAQFKSFKDSVYFFRINHVKLLKGILNHFGINDHELVHDTIRATGIVSKKARMEALSVQIPEQVVANLFNILEREGSPEQLSSALRPLMRRNNEAGNDVKKSMKELENIINYAQKLGVKSRIVISPMLVVQPEYFSGMLVQLVRKRKRGYDILASGGRFDSLIEAFATKLNVEEKKNRPPSGVGISIGLDVIAASILDSEIEANFNRLDVLIYGPHLYKLELASQLWSKGIRCLLCDPGWSMDDVQDHAQETGATFIVIFQDKTDTYARLRNLNNDRFTEKQVTIADLFDKLSKDLDESKNSSSSTGPGSLMRIDSTSRVVPLQSTGPNVTIEWQYFRKYQENNPERKRKNVEAAINRKLSATQAVVLVLPFQGQVIRSIANIMDFENESKYGDCLKELLSRHTKHKKELSSICEDISDLRSGKAELPGVFVLFSSEDYSYQVLLL